MVALSGKVVNFHKCGRVNGNVVNQRSYFAAIVTFKH